MAASQCTVVPDEEEKHAEQDTDYFRLRRCDPDVMSATPALAQGRSMDSRTEFTFNQPVELPGVTLPPWHLHLPLCGCD